MADRVVVIGGGSGGTILANALSDRRFDVTLVSASPDHLFQPGLLYTAFTHSRANLVRPERDLLKAHVEYVQAWVKRVDFTARTVTLLDGRRIDYDIVVLATGIQT
jgi:sulfide:quinone oxidoreductase